MTVAMNRVRLFCLQHVPREKQFHRSSAWIVPLPYQTHFSEIRFAVASLGDCKCLFGAIESDGDFDSSVVLKSPRDQPC
jgi:hypothetical protein